jgi:hypothetical protein
VLSDCRYQAVVDSVSQQDGVSYYAVTFTEYGNQDTVRAAIVLSVDRVSAAG